jgi:L-threonylcarbamoyladenylate synthase
MGAEMRGEVARPSPGMTDPHKAPRARVVAFDASSLDEALGRARAAEGDGELAGAIVWSAVAPPVARVVRLPDDPAGYARGLYAALHDLDAAGCDLVLVERVPPGAAWDGVRDRIDRAARSTSG